MKKEKKKIDRKGIGGRPEVPYDEEVAKEICFIISSTTMGIKKILDSDERFPCLYTFYKWLMTVREMSELYRDAKEKQQALLVDSQDDLVLEMMEKFTYIDAQGNKRIDAPAMTAAKIRCDNIKWNAARYASKIFGPKPDDSPATKDDVRGISEELKQLRKTHEKPY